QLVYVLSSGVTSSFSRQGENSPQRSQSSQSGIESSASNCSEDAAELEEPLAMAAVANAASKEKWADRCLGQHSQVCVERMVAFGQGEVEHFCGFERSNRVDLFSQEIWKRQ